MNLRHSLLYTLLFLSTFHCIGQETKKELRKNRSTYLTLGIGNGKSIFRDFATSPLFYRSFPGNILFNRTKRDSSRSSKFELKYTGGIYISRVEKFKLGKAIGHIGQLHYQQLYQIPKWCNEKWNIKAGGAFNYLQTFRINRALQNNAVGSEAFINIFAAIRANKDISRNKYIDKKILNFIKYKRKPRKRELSYQFEGGLINSTIRNGYAYIGQSSVINKTPLLDNYQFKMFAGFRLRSEIAYNVYLNNGNAIALSYQWDVMKSGRERDKFELAIHTISLSILFNTK